MFGELTDEVTQQIEAIKTWALVLEIAAMVTALGVVVMAVTLLTYAVQSLRRQDELLKTGACSEGRPAGAPAD